MNFRTDPRRARLAAGLLVTSLAVGACRQPGAGVGPRHADVFDEIDAAPLLLDVGPPEEEPAAEPLPVRTPIGGDERFSLDLRGSSLAEAVHLIAQHAGVNLVLDAGLDGAVDASFPSVTLDEALTILLARNGLRLGEAPGPVYWVERADGTEPATKEFHLRSIRAADVAENVQGLVSSGTKVVADLHHNYVLVRGTSGDVEAVGRYLDAVDRLKQQVLVEVHLFEVRLDDSFELGLSHAIDGTIGDQAYEIVQNLAGGTDDFSLTLAGGDFESTIRALRRYVGLDLLSSPRVLAVTNTEATIDVLEEIPYVETTSVTSGTTDGVGSTVQESVVFKEAGIRLRVVPTIQEDGVLQLEIEQSLAEVIDFFNEIPVLDTRRLSSQFLVRDRQTVVLGGLMQDRHIEADEGVPLLMHLPLVGGLFARDDDSVTKRELLVFVTCRILDPSQASRLTPLYQDRYRERRAVLEPPEPPEPEEDGGG